MNRIMPFVDLVSQQQRILSLPMHPYLSVEEQEKVVETLVKGLDGN